MLERISASNINKEDVIDLGYKEETKVIDEKVMTGIFNGLLAASELERNNKFGEAAKEFIGLGIDIGDFDEYDFRIDHEIEKFKEQIICSYYKDKEVDHDAMWNVLSLYANHKTVNQSIRNLVSDREGGACCADKSSWMTNCYRKYLLTKEMPDMTINDHCYWKPHFGTAQQWIAFCNGSLRMVNGNYKEFIVALKDLLQATISKE